MHTPTPHNPTYYEILSLSQAALTSHSDPSTLIKRAYRRALLSHHPDKTTTPPTKPQSQTASTSFTIDQISTAYATLSRPSQRAAYDRSLLLSQQQRATDKNGAAGGPSNFQTGIETVDLDDLDFEEEDDDSMTRWYRSCRCGNPRGYLFSEADLEDAADLGELMVGCADCSLWLRVHFAVVDEHEEDEHRHGGEPVSGTTGVGAVPR